MTEEETRALVREAVATAEPHVKSDGDMVRFCLYMIVRMIHFCRVLIGDDDTIKALEILLEQAKRPLPLEAYPVGHPKGPQP